MNFHLLACLWVFLLSAAHAEDSPAEFAVVTAEMHAPGGKPAVWKKLYGGDGGLLTEIKQSTADARLDGTLVFLLKKGEDGKWLDLTKPFSISNFDTLRFNAIALTIPPTLKPGASFQDCLTSLADCWLNETNLERLYRHTEIIASCTSPVLRQGYAAKALETNIPDDLKKLCAAMVVVSAHPEKAFERYFDILTMKPVGVEFKDAVISVFRSRILLQLGSVTNAANYEKHWSRLAALPDELKALVLSQLTGNPFYRDKSPLNPPQYLLPHRPELLVMLRSANDDLAYEAFVAICIADETYQDTYRSVKEFAKHREEAIKMLKVP